LTAPQGKEWFLPSFAVERLRDTCKMASRLCLGLSSQSDRQKIWSFFGYFFLFSSQKKEKSNNIYNIYSYLRASIGLSKEAL
jgi:hypothetical protein